MTGDAETEPVHYGKPSGSDGTGEPPYGRERESADIDGCLTAPDGPHLVVVLGERGAGRTTFVRAAARRQRAAGTAVLSVDCVPGDGERHWLLALRLVRDLEQHRSDPAGQRRPGNPVAEMLVAVEHGDQAAAADAVTAALAQSAPTVIVVDDAQHADLESLGLLGALDFARAAPHVRLVVSLLQHAGTAGRSRGSGGAAGQLGHHPAAHTIELAPLERQQVAAVLAQRLQARPDDALTGLVHRLSRGAPAAVDALLTEWAGQDAIRVIGGHAFLGPRAAVPVLPECDRFSLALHELGEPAVAVASALSVLWPLGRAAEPLAAAVTGLPAKTVRAGLRALIEAGVLDELPARGGGAARGWTFRIPLTEHTVREQLGPLDRSRLAAAAVEALWAAQPEPSGGDASGRPADPIAEETDIDPYPLNQIAQAGAVANRQRPGADADTYPPDQIAQAGALLDRGRPAAGKNAEEVDADTYLPDQIAQAGALLDRGRPGADGIVEEADAGTYPLNQIAQAGALLDRGRPGADGIVEEADAGTYLPDQIAQAGALLDRGRAVAELIAAAERRDPRPGYRSRLRWLRAAARLVEEPGVRDRLMLRYAACAAAAGDYPACKEAVQVLLRGAAGTRSFTDEMLHEAVGLLVGAVSADGDLRGLSRIAEPRKWQSLALPAAVRAPGRALALCALGRWQVALALLVRNERQWNGAGPASVLPTLYRAVAELTLGRPERFRQSLTMPEVDSLSAQSRYTVTVIQADQLLGLSDLRGAADLLSARQLAVEDLPVYSRFLWRQLEGRWEEAMALARRLFANGQRDAPGLAHHLFPERATVIFLARGRIRTAVRLVGTRREDLDGAAGYEHILCRAEAEAARTLGDPAEAERVLRRGLAAAQAGGEVYATDELWAELALLHTDAGDHPRALDCVRHLERIADRTGSERTRLLWLLASGRLLRADDADTARKQLLDAVVLARRRGQPFETGVTLLAAAQQGEDRAAMLSEAYELFGGVGALLWRFRARAGMRRAGLAVPGRGQATAESEHLLATLVSEGLTNRQIAAALGLSQDAVANRLTRLFARTGARSRTEIVTAVMRRSTPAADW